MALATASTGASTMHRWGSMAAAGGQCCDGVIVVVVVERSGTTDNGLAVLSLCFLGCLHLRKTSV